MWFLIGILVIILVIGLLTRSMDKEYEDIKNLNRFIHEFEESEEKDIHGSVDSYDRVKIRSPSEME